MVDLQIQIATHQKDEDTARNRLEILQIVDHRSFYYHRRSTVEYAFGKPEEAYKAAYRAFEEARRPTVAILSQLIKCEIETNRIEGAGDHLTLLDRKFPKVKHDIKVGLRCKWEIAQNHFDNALGLWSRLRDKSKPVHKSLLRDALNGLVGSLPDGDPRVTNYRHQLSDLEQDLRDIDPANLDITAEDDR